MGELRVFAFLPKALGSFCLGDGRARKDIAEAAGINPSMLSGYCSGRLVPSLDHLDRLLTALGRSADDLAEEMRFASHQVERARYTRPFKRAPEEIPAVEAALKRVLKEVEFLIISEMNGLEPGKPAPSKSSQAKAKHAQHGPPPPGEPGE